MRILAVDVGTGTQDVLLFDSSEELENCVQLVLPSPTVTVAGKIHRATDAGETVLLTGVTMGGGPSSWAARDHALAGLPIYATPEAAKTFDDDLDVVREMGIQIVGEDETAALGQVTRIRLADVDIDRLIDVLRQLEVEPPDAVAVAVFDHGNAPPGYSDRRFRFDYLAGRVDLGFGAFAFFPDQIPERLTRLQAVARTLGNGRPALLMDTGPAAIIGALEDTAVRAMLPGIVLNIGNFHTLAFHLDGQGIAGMFEHHSGELRPDQLKQFIRRLQSGELTNKEIFGTQGHGAIVRRSGLGDLRVAVIGPKRNLLKGSPLQPYFAAPHGDMMLAGCYGLLRAWAEKDADVRDVVESRLGPPI